MCIPYSVLSCKLAISFRLFQYSFFQVKMANHYEVHLIFQDAEHQLQENILHHFLFIVFFLEILIELRSIFESYLLEAFATLPSHMNYLHRKIEDMTILILL